MFVFLQTIAKEAIIIGARNSRMKNYTNPWDIVNKLYAKSLDIGLFYCSIINFS